ncbi:extracellular solute-binding protein [Caballeronia glebae]|uniref:Extracellular solute-binding protein n=1 Tax=Caballeronia glebae TaxID=1777143 RepID=A0A158B0V7_9BURK|nr:ABC transporter substrate-binding protein [Caballeronia glebae]SAK63366.1 extracellular solute-binding protein [Caballeronia glebae]
MTAKLKLLCAVSLTFVAGVADVAHADELSDIKARGTLVCGVLSTLPPFGFQDPDTREVVGYDIDFCKGVAKELGVKPELKVMSLDSRIPELTQGRVDILAAVLGYNPQRAQQIDFSKAYFVSQQVMAAKASSPFKHRDDLAGKRISTIKGSSNIPVIQRVLPTAQQISYDDGPSAFMALVQNKVDGFVLSETLMRRFIEKLGPNANQISVLTPPVGLEYWGLGVKKGETKLLEAVNTALDNMEKSGQSQQIFQKWLGDKSTLKMTRDFKTAQIPSN